MGNKPWHSSIRLRHLSLSLSIVPAECRRITIAPGDLIDLQL
jgi:hypothetical protein